MTSQLLLKFKTNDTHKVSMANHDYIITVDLFITLGFFISNSSH